MCCLSGSTWWHVEGVWAPGLLSGWVWLWLLLSSSVWPLLKFSKTSRSSSVLVQGKGSSFNRLLLSLTPCFEDRQTLSTVMQASSHRNQAKTNKGLKQGCLHCCDPQIHLVLVASHVMTMLLCPKY